MNKIYTNKGIHKILKNYNDSLPDDNCFKGFIDNIFIWKDMPLYYDMSDKTKKIFSRLAEESN